MIDQMELPSLQNFKEVLNLFNLRKLYQYLLYFVKNQTHALNPTQNTVSSSRFSVRNTPTTKDRHLLFQNMLEILNEGINPNEIISVQRFIMGMIMLGHIHIFELMMAELLPFFVQAIEEDNANRGLQSQISKFQQSELHLPVDKQQIENLEQHRMKIRKKLRQFYKQTFIVLAQWFPKSFYNPNQISWFKKMIHKHDIKCRFIVYYTLQKMNEYDSMLKKLKLNGSEGECKECIYCIQNGGEGYSSCEGMISMKNIPSIIQQQSQSLVQVQPKVQNQRKDRNKTDTSRWTEETESIANNHLKENKEVEDQDKSRNKSNKIRQLIKKRREQKKSNVSSSDNSVSSRRIYKNKSETLIKKLRQKKSASNYYKMSEYKGLKNEPREESKLGINELRKKIKEKKANHTISDQYQLETKGKDKFMSKLRSRQNSSNTINISQSYSIGNDEKSLKVFSSLKEAMENSQNQKLVFEEDYFKSLGFVSKKLFRKECLKKKKKILNYSSEGITLDIVSKVRNSTQLEVKLNFFSQYSQKNNIQLMCPLSLLIQQNKNTYVFDFEKQFEPVVMKFNGKDLILPVLRTELLEQYACQQMNKRVNFGNQLELIFKLDIQVFQDLSYLASILNLKLIYENTYQNKFLFFKRPIVLNLSKHSQCLYRLSGKTEVSNQQKFQFLLREIKMCLEKRSAKAVKMMRRKSKEKSFL